jgi:hypothetical protein
LLLPRVQTESQIEEAIGTLCGYSFLVQRGDSGEEEHRVKKEEEEEWYNIY